MTAIAPSLLPAGTSLLAYNSCSAPVENGFTNRLNQAKVVTDPQRGQVLEAAFKKGLKGGNGPVQVDRSFPKCSVLSLGYDVWFSPNWLGHPSGVNKMFHGWFNKSNRFVVSATGHDFGPLMAEIRVQNVVGGSKNYPAKIAILRGVWAHIDVILTPTLSSVYVDGKLSSSGAVNYGPGLWEKVSWNPQWGGTGSVIVTPQFMRVDSITVYGK